MMRALYKATQLCEGFLSIPRALTRKFTGEEGLTRRREGREGRGELLHFHAARRWLVPAIFLALLFTASGQDHPTGTVPPQAGDGDFIMGKITVNKQAGTVRFPATVNMADGALEYLLVSDKGKTHESLFATAVAPFQLQVAMLLLGVTPTREIKDLPPEQINAEFLKGAPELKGDKVDVLVSWKSGADAQVIRAEEWVSNRLTHAPMTAGPWIYTGSAIYQKEFLAQEDGSIIALVTDPAALVNNPRPGHDDDSIWSVRNEKAPPVGTPVEITFRLLTTKSTQPKQPLK